jgi:hypothetical protein
MAVGLIVMMLRMILAFALGVSGVGVVPHFMPYDFAALNGKNDKALASPEVRCRGHAVC